jgi:hypothetical protein
LGPCHFDCLFGGGSHLTRCSNWHLVKKFTLIKITNKKIMHLSGLRLLIKVDIPFNWCKHFSQIKPWKIVIFYIDSFCSIILTYTIQHKTCWTLVMCLWNLQVSWSLFHWMMTQKLINLCLRRWIHWLFTIIKYLVSYFLLNQNLGDLMKAKLTT